MQLETPNTLIECQFALCICIYVNVAVCTVVYLMSNITSQPLAIYSQRTDHLVLLQAFFRALLQLPIRIQGNYSNLIPIMHCNIQVMSEQLLAHDLSSSHLVIKTTLCFVVSQLYRIFTKSYIVHLQGPTSYTQFIGDFVLRFSYGLCIWTSILRLELAIARRTLLTSVFLVSMVPYQKLMLHTTFANYSHLQNYKG